MYKKNVIINTRSGRQFSGSRYDADGGAIILRMQQIATCAFQHQTHFSLLPRLWAGALSISTSSFGQSQPYLHVAGPQAHSPSLDNYFSDEWMQTGHLFNSYDALWSLGKTLANFHRQYLVTLPEESFRKSKTRAVHGKLLLQNIHYSSNQGFSITNPEGLGVSWLRPRSPTIDIATLIWSIQRWQRRNKLSGYIDSATYFIDGYTDQWPDEMRDDVHKVLNDIQKDPMKYIEPILTEEDMERDPPEYFIPPDCVG